MSQPSSSTTIRLIDDGYRAGGCNIGPAEIQRRRLAAAVSVTGTAGIAALLVASGADPLVRLLLILPLYGTAVSVYQAVARFCVGFAMAGVANFGAVGTRTRVDDDGARRADRARAFRAIALSGLIAVVVGVAFAALPL